MVSDVLPFLHIDDVSSDWWEAQYYAEDDHTPSKFIPDHLFDKILINFDSKNLFIFSYIFLYIFSLFVHHSFVTDISSPFFFLLLYFDKLKRGGYHLGFNPVPYQSYLMRSFLFKDLY